MNKKLKKLILRSFDEELSEQDKEELKNALELYPELRKEKLQIEAIRATLEDMPEKSFAPFFADRVMANIDSFHELSSIQDQFLTSLIKLFRPVVITGVAAALILAAVNMSLDGEFSLSSAFTITNSVSEDLWNTPLMRLFGEL